MKDQPQNLSRGQRLLLFLFGSLCVAVGLWLLVGIFTDILYGYWRTRGEVTTEAQLRSVESRTSGGGRGGVTSSTVVRYDYSVGGQFYTGSRIAIFKQTGDFYERLSAAFRAGTPIRVFIDPRHPHFAVIDRDFSWWPLVVAVPFSLAFTIIGFLILRHLLRTPATPNHALQRTAPRVTAAASHHLRPPPPSPAQQPRRAPQSLSLGSLGHSRRRHPKCGFAACSFGDFRQHGVVRPANSLRFSYEDVVHQFKAMREKQGIFSQVGCSGPGLS